MFADRTQAAFLLLWKPYHFVSLWETQQKKNQLKKEKQTSKQKSYTPSII